MRLSLFMVQNRNNAYTWFRCIAVGNDRRRLPLELCVLPMSAVVLQSPRVTLVLSWQPMTGTQRAVKHHRHLSTMLTVELRWAFWNPAHLLSW